MTRSRDVERAILARERAALRRLGTLAGTASPDVMFAAMAEELARIADLQTGATHLDMAAVVRFDGDAAVIMAAWGETLPAPVGSRWPLDGDSVNARVRRTGRPARIDDMRAAPGTIAQEAQSIGIRSAVGVPIVVDGELWGSATVLSSRPDPLPPETEERLADFAELAAAAISGARARERVCRLSSEQAALRRVATLVAEGVDPERVRASVREEAGRLLEHREELAAVEPRFEELVATATANARMRADSRRLADEQTALRRIATLVAQRTDPDEVCGAVTREIAGLYGLDSSSVIRFEPGDRLRVVATTIDEALVGTSWPAAGGVSERIARTGRPARIDDLPEEGEGDVARLSGEFGVRSSLGVPIVVERELWGTLLANSQTAVPPRTEERLESFAELTATAIANARARERVRRLADEQAALRRLATLVARGARPEDVFASVVDEVGTVLGASDTRLTRYHDDGFATILASRGVLKDRLPAGSTFRIAGRNIHSIVCETGRAARIDDYDSADGWVPEQIGSAGVRSAVGCPVVVGGQVWGVIVVATLEPEPLPPDTAARLMEFTELVATAIANLEARAALAASRVRIVAAADEARQRVERDLHDGVQQRLVSLALRLRAAEELAGGELREELAQTGRELHELLDDLRELSRGIHPPVLTEAGLRAALRALARRSAIPVRLTCDVTERLDDSVEVTAYYIVSEALANVVKHARASRATVQVACEDGTLSVAVADDGAGGARLSAGSGLMGLADRVEAHGGCLALTSPAGGGTTLSATIPLGAT